MLEGDFRILGINTYVQNAYDAFCTTLTGRELDLCGEQKRPRERAGFPAAGGGGAPSRAEIVIDLTQAALARASLL